MLEGPDVKGFRHFAVSYDRLDLVYAGFDTAFVQVETRRDLAVEAEPRNIRAECWRNTRTLVSSTSGTPELWQPVTGDLLTEPPASWLSAHVGRPNGIRDLKFFYSSFVHQHTGIFTCAMQSV